MYDAIVLADSVNPLGHRLTTFEVVMPRMVLADITRHRCASFSVESTRAVPIEERIRQVREEPFVPIFRERAKGMARGKELGPSDQRWMRRSWLAAAQAAADRASDLASIEKGLAGRLLEPYIWVNFIMSATEWDNFFALRDSAAAQYELAHTAALMRGARADSTPQKLDWGQWHLPLWHNEDVLTEWEHMDDPLHAAKVSAGRCASISYAKHSINEPPVIGYERWSERLAPAAHWSPGEHPARSITEDEKNAIVCRQDYERRRAKVYEDGPPDERYIDSIEFIGNYRGFVQLRKHYPGEAVHRA